MALSGEAARVLFPEKECHSHRHKNQREVYAVGSVRQVLQPCTHDAREETGAESKRQGG